MYARETEELVGINLLGVRYRHDLCHHWLSNKMSLHEVIRQLGAANFDPEFYRRYEQELWSQYRQRFPDRQLLSGKRESTWWKLRKKFGLA